MQKLLLYVVAVVIGLLGRQTPGFSLNADEILKKIDANLVFESRSATAVMRISSTEGIREKKLIMYNEGINKAMAEFVDPLRDKGVKYLKIDKNLWMYLPSAGRSVKISGHMLRQSMMGSDMSYEDSMENPSLEANYTAELLPSETIDGKTLLVLKLSARGPEVTYPAEKIWVDAENWLPLKVEKYATTGKLLKIQELGNIQKFGSRSFPLYYKTVDVLRGTGGTEFILSNVKFKVEIPETTFSLRALERR